MLLPDGGIGSRCGVLSAGVGGAADSEVCALDSDCVCNAATGGCESVTSSPSISGAPSVSGQPSSKPSSSLAPSTSSGPTPVGGIVTLALCTDAVDPLLPLGPTVGCVCLGGGELKSMIAVDDLLGFNQPLHEH